MNRRIWVGGIIGIATSVGVGYFLLSGRIRNGPDHSVHDVLVHISSPRRMYFRGEPVWLDISITNHESTPLWGFGDYDLTGAYPYTFEGYDRNGRRLPLTAKGRQYEAWIAEDRIRSPVSMPLPLNLLPGHTLTQRIMISQYVDITGAPSDPISGTRTPVTFLVRRYGVPSQRLTVGIITYDYDPTDRRVRDTLKSGRYEGERMW